MRRFCSPLIAAGLVALGSAWPLAQQATLPLSIVGPTLRPTTHPRLPADPTQVWMAPVPAASNQAGAVGTFTNAVKLEVSGSYAKALPLLSPSLLKGGQLADYVTYYRGLAELRVGRSDDARRTFQSIVAARPAGYLAEAAALREAEADESLGDERAALAVYERLSKAKTTAPDDVLMRLGRAAHAVGDVDKALTAFSTVYYEFPFGDAASAAGLELDRLPNRGSLSADSDRYRLELKRAEQLFTAKRYGQARLAFDALRGPSQGDNRELVSLRVAECDYFLKRARSARDGLKPYSETARRQGEALFFYAITLRELGNRSEYLRLIREVADDFPTETWAEEALNNLSTYYIVQDDDAKADETFREMLAKFPTGRYAERAAWKIGWAAYRNGHYADTVQVFEGAAARFPRSDYRPPWIYWSARAHEALNEPVLATARYRLVSTDYRNSYYGRLALTRMSDPSAGPRTIADIQSPASLPDTAEPQGEDIVLVAALPPNQEVIRALLGLGLFDQAIDELHYAQKAWGDSAGIEATLAWIFEQQGRRETGDRQFTLYRAAINTMKRAYPQFMAAGGEALPKELLRVIFPLGYWDLIRKYASESNLDPYLVAALMAQESTFVPNIVSYAKAVGLMQLEAATARQYAKKLGMRYSPKLLTTPESNIRLGTAFLADEIKRFGEPYLVLASYNAGPGAVRRWMAERPGLQRDEFIDDIPFPQTQGYVKKILGTAEDYRLLYSSDAGSLDVATPPAASSPVPSAAPRAAVAGRRVAAPRTPTSPSAKNKKKSSAVRSKSRKAA